MTHTVLALLDPSAQSIANAICEAPLNMCRWRTEVTQGSIGSVRTVDKLAVHHSPVTADDGTLEFWQRVAAGALAEWEGYDYSGHTETDLAAFYAAVSVTIVEGSQSFSDMLTDAGYVVTPPAPTPPMVRAERDRRIERGSTFEIQTDGYGPVKIVGDLRIKTDLMALAEDAKAGQSVTLTEAPDDPDDMPVIHTLTAVQFGELMQKGSGYLKGVSATANKMMLSLAPFTGGIPLDFTDDSYWP